MVDLSDRKEITCDYQRQKQLIRFCAFGIECVIDASAYRFILLTISERLRVNGH